MKQSEVREGEVYRARVSGKRVLVRVTAINCGGGSRWRFQVLNLSTGRTCWFRSAGRLSPAQEGVHA